MFYSAWGTIENNDEKIVENFENEFDNQYQYNNEYDNEYNNEYDNEYYNEYDNDNEYYNDYENIVENFENDFENDYENNYENIVENFNSWNKQKSRDAATGRSLKAASGNAASANAASANAVISRSLNTASANAASVNAAISRSLNTASANAVISRSLNAASINAPIIAYLKSIDVDYNQPIPNNPTLIAYINNFNLNNTKNLNINDPISMELKQMNEAAKTAGPNVVNTFLVKYLIEKNLKQDLDKLFDSQSKSNPDLLKTNFDFWKNRIIMTNNLYSKNLPNQKNNTFPFDDIEELYIDVCDEFLSLNPQKQKDLVKIKNHILSLGYTIGSNLLPSTYIILTDNESSIKQNTLIEYRDIFDDLIVDLNNTLKTIKFFASH